MIVYIPRTGPVSYALWKNLSWVDKSKLRRETVERPIPKRTGTHLCLRSTAGTQQIGLSYPPPYQEKKNVCTKSNTSVSKRTWRTWVMYENKNSNEISITINFPRTIPTERIYKRYVLVRKHICIGMCIYRIRLYGCCMDMYTVRILLMMRKKKYRKYVWNKLIIYYLCSISNRRSTW